MSGRGGDPSGPVVRAAARWHALHREGPLQPGQREAFMAWLAASPEHLREYLAIGLVARELREALREAKEPRGHARGSGDVIPFPRRTPTPVRESRPRAERAPKTRARRLAAGIAALLACATTMFWAWPRTDTHASGHGEQRTLALRDGTQVRLDAESALRATTSPFHRKVTLLRGRAAFDVAEDRRPFEVTAGHLRVEDIGTAFDVALHGRETRIGVSEGRVRIWGLDDPDSHRDGHPRPLAELSAGQTARVAPGGRHVSLGTEDVDTMTAWTRGLLVFRDEPLAGVAAAFNRHNRTRIVVEDAEAAAFRLTGRLHAHDVPAFRAFLERQPSLRVSAAGDAIRVRSGAE